MTSKRIVLKSCPKGYTRDLDKTVTPSVTIKNVLSRLEGANMDIVAGTRRVDAGRLGIPVFLGLCGKDARTVMPTRKQMGKGSSEEQALASALMEVMERFAFFSFWQRAQGVFVATWSEAEDRFGQDLIALDEILRSVGDSLSIDHARRIMNLVPWQFYPATHLRSGRIVWLPLDWFRMLGEFNGSSAGNSVEESLLQGLSELVERHVCCRIDRERNTVPTIATESCQDATLSKLIAAFEREKIHLILKDFSFGMPLPTVGALAWDESTFPERSEIVLTAGTASSPAKAAIRAVTEVAQLAGDFCSSACYEASGLPKFTQLEQMQWLLNGPEIQLKDLPTVEADDICTELLTAIDGLEPYKVYAVETTHPALGIPAHYTIVPGLQFRERDKNQSLGLFVGRKLAETCTAEMASQGLLQLEQLCPETHYLNFFQGILALRENDPNKARDLFLKAFPLQPDADSSGLAIFYAGHAETLLGNWAEAVPFLKQAVSLCPEMKEYGNLLGVSLYKTKCYAEAAQAFKDVLKLDKGSAMDRANLGVCCKFLGKRNEAIQHLEAALELDSTLDFARNHLKDLQEESTAKNHDPLS